MTPSVPTKEGKKMNPITYKQFKVWHKKKELYKHVDEIKQRGLLLSVDDIEDLAKQLKEQFKEFLKEQLDEFWENFE